ncbi:hypothetical protein Vi05172_g11231 [Venturia inaequalis]|nr:hypothetical protein Vi05172_g11231 [Venturia inaequalis]
MAQHLGVIRPQQKVSNVNGVARGFRQESSEPIVDSPMPPHPFSSLDNDLVLIPFQHSHISSNDRRKTPERDISLNIGAPQLQIPTTERIPDV